VKFKIKFPEFYRQLNLKVRNGWKTYRRNKLVYTDRSCFCDGQWRYDRQQA